MVYFGHNSQVINANATPLKHHQGYFVEFSFLLQNNSEIPFVQTLPDVEFYPNG